MKNNDLAGDNLLYKQHDVEKAFANGLSSIIRHEFPKVERRHNLSIEEFQKQYIAKNKPVILAGLTECSRKTNMFSLDYFSEKCGDAEVLIDLYDSKLTHKGTISDLVKQIKLSSSDKPVYLQEWWFQEDFESFFDDFGDISHFADDWGHKVMGFMNHTLWIGSKGALTPIHEDTIHFNLWTAQLFGKKEWFLLSKGTFLHAKADGSPDYERLLNEQSSQPMSCTLEAGDILYMPYKWWHRTETLEHSASLNTTYITEEIVQPYIRGIFTIPLMMSLRRDELRKLNPMRFNVTMERTKKLAHLIDFNPDYIIHTIKNAHNQDIEAEEERKHAA